MPENVVAGGTTYVDTFLGYSIDLAAGWTGRPGAPGELIITSDTGFVKISSRPVDRSVYASVQHYVIARPPERPADWMSWQTVGSTPIKGVLGYEFQYDFTTSNAATHRFMQWYFRGDRLVEVITDVPQDLWLSDASLQASVRKMTNSFDLDATGGLMTSDMVFQRVEEWLNSRVPSGLYVRDEEIKGIVEVSCTGSLPEIFRGPVYVGPGEWRVFTDVAPYGYHEWNVMEPQGIVLRAFSNPSRC